MDKISFNGKRAIAGVALAIILLCLANHYFGFNLIGRFSKDALLLSFILLAISIFYVGPTLSEQQDYRDRKNRELMEKSERDHE